MNPNQAMWEQGDFTRIAQSMRNACATAANNSSLHKSKRPGHFMLEATCLRVAVAVARLNPRSFARRLRLPLV